VEVVFILHPLFLLFLTKLTKRANITAKTVTNLIKTRKLSPTFAVPLRTMVSMFGATSRKCEGGAMASTQTAVCPPVSQEIICKVV
jgi:hypothetical protein